MQYILQFIRYIFFSNYLRLDCFWIKDALSILTLWVQSRREILVQTSPKNSSRTVGKFLLGYGLCKFPYLGMSPLCLIYGVNFRKHDCTISLQFCAIDYLFKFPKWWLRIKFLAKVHNISLYLSYSMTHLYNRSPHESIQTFGVYVLNFILYAQLVLDELSF